MLTSKDRPYKLTKIGRVVPSLSHDINLSGQLYIAGAPGKKDSKWERVLELDLQVIKNKHIDIIVCLLEWTELKLLKLSDYLLSAQQQGFQVLHLPIKDRNIPTLAELITVIPIIVAALTNGKKVLIHCREGLGRAGLVCACCICHFDYNGSSAINLVRQRRKGAIQTKSQENMVLLYSRQLRSVSA